MNVLDSIYMSANQKSVGITNRLSRTANVWHFSFRWSLVIFVVKAVCERLVCTAFTP